MDNSITAIILGGGQGTRLYPLTKYRSKPAVPIAGKYRLVDIPISNCLNSDIRRIYVLTQFNSASLNSHIKNTYNFDVFSHGFVDILAAEQTRHSESWYQGTADAVHQSLHHLRKFNHDYVLILSGDQLYQMDYQKMLKKHTESDANLTVATIPVTAGDATGFGIMKTDDSGTVQDFVEKPGSEGLDQWKSEVNEEFANDARHFLASMGIYIFDRNILDDLFENNPDATDFGKELIPKAINEELKVTSYSFDGYWTDVGTVQSFFDANIDLTKDLPSFNLFDNENAVFTRARMLPASKLSGTTFDHSVLSEGCLIEASRIERSVIGIRSRIGKGTTVEDSIIVGNDYFQSLGELKDEEGHTPSMGIGKRCFVSHTIIDKNCRIGHDVRITGGNNLEDGEYEYYHVVNGVVIVTKGTVIPNGTHI